MNNEIELKLNPNSQDVDAIVTWLNQHSDAQPNLSLSNSYYDTAKLALSGARAALRIRREVKQDGEQSVERFEQTLKTRGTSVGGIHQRQEWDWPLSEDNLAIDLLAENDVRTALPEAIDLSDIKRLFSTDFERQVWLYKSGASEIEIVLDQGQILASNQQGDTLTKPLLELELELKKGQLADIFSFAEQLVANFSLAMSDISKAERGYRLAGFHEQNKPQSVKFSDATNAGNCLLDVFAQEFSQLQRLLEQVLLCQPQDSEYLLSRSSAILQLQQQLQQLRFLLKVFGGTVKRNQTIAVRQKLEQAQLQLKTLLPWATLLQSEWPAESEQAILRHFKKQLLALSRQQIWGQLTLTISQWLINLPQQLEAQPDNKKAAAFNWTGLVNKQLKLLWQEQNLTLLQGNWLKWQEQENRLMHLRQFIRYARQDNKLQKQVHAGALTLIDKLQLEVQTGLVRNLSTPADLFKVVEQDTWQQWLAEFETEQHEFCLQLAQHLNQLAR